MQIWLAIILMTCKHSIACMMRRDFRQDRTLLGQIELRWVYDCSKEFSLHSWIQHPISPTVTTKNSEQKEVTWQQYRLCLAVAEYQIFGGKHFLFFWTRIGKDLVVAKGSIPSEEAPLPMDLPSRQETQVDFQYFWQSLMST